MAVRFPVLLAAEDLAPRYRWRLVSSLFAQKRALVEGAVAQAAVMAMCYVRTTQFLYLALALAAPLVTLLRLAIARRYACAVAQPGRREAHTPHFWAGWFTVGAAGTAAVWAVADLCVFLWSPDPVMQLFVVAIQAGWLSGAAVRNAVAPRAVLAQSCLTMLPTFAGTALSPASLLDMLAPFCLVQLSTTLSMSHYTGLQITQMMLSEQRLEAANAQLTELSATDPLTGIGNRRAFDTTMNTQWGRAARDATDLSLLLIDADHFKLYNDLYGHPAGDACLRLIASVIGKTLRRPTDLAARFGGEEFIALLPDTNETGARAVAERVRLAVIAANVRHASSRFGHVTVSIGVACVAPQQGDTAQSLIDLADRALYRAKQNGRNQVRAASEGVDIGLWREGTSGVAGRE